MWPNSDYTNLIYFSADLSEYDESMRTSILDFSGPISGHPVHLARLNLLADETRPKAISENDLLCIYDASPSPPNR